jgi:hypothetical protein
LDKNIFNLSQEELLEMKKKYPFSCIPDLALNKILFSSNENVSLQQISELIRKTNNPGLSLASVIDRSGISSYNNGNKNYDKQNIETNSVDEDKLNSELNEEIATEQLAKIYLQQGLKKEAIEIYKKISLQNKKKSNKFAKF